MAGLLCAFKSSFSAPLVRNFKSVSSSTTSTFFNRNKEMDLFYSGLKGEPTFNVITGPVNSGKSKMLTKLSDTLKSRNVPVLNINLRSVSFNSVETLVSTLADEGNSWLQQFRDAVKRFKLDAKGYGFEVSLGVVQDDVPPIRKLNDLLHLFEKKLIPHTFWYGEKAPLFIIDEANELRALTKEDDGNAALHNFFKWLVLNTKERNRFHVLLSSSDSFFHLWVSKYIGSTRYETYVIADLQEDEARKFWEHLLKNYDHRSSVPLPEFEEIYRMCRGNMFLMKKALHYWLSEYNAQHIGWNGFPYVVQESAKLSRAYYRPTDLRLSESKSQPLWTKEDLINMMTKLVCADGFVFYTDLCDKLGGAVVDSFIEHNIVHLRPTKRCTYDLPPSFYCYPDDIPIVTAESACGLYAMSRLLKQLKV